MGPLLGRLAELEVAPAGPSKTADAVQLEVKMVENSAINDTGNDAIGTRAPLSCPDCGGPLWEIDNQPLLRYRCRLGHALTASAVIEGQGAAIGRSLWASLRLLEERAKILERMAADERRHGREASAAAYAIRSAESQQHATQIRALIDRRNEP
jgi:two-component system chemotaxis response regulator CheB